MCGRLVLVDNAELVKALLEAEEMPPTWPTRYNLAPTDTVPVMREPGKVELLRWGMSLRNPRAGGFNARRESLHIYDTRRRCLVVASGFYEWRRIGPHKQPHLVRRADALPIVFAGLFDATDGVAIVTAPAEGIVATLHDRMPVVLEPSRFRAYLDPRNEIGTILAEASADGLTMYAVNARVGNVREDDPGLMLRVVDDTYVPPRQLGLFERSLAESRRSADVTK